MRDEILRDKLVDAYVAAIPLIMLNLLWFAVSLPIITIIPATYALFYATHQLAHTQSADWRTFFEGFRRFFWHSWVWGFLNVFVAAVLLSNLVFYSTATTEWASAAQIVILLIGIAWIALQMSIPPLLFEQEHPRFRLAFRNSLVLFIKRPVSSLAVAALIVGFITASTLIIPPAWIVITASGTAYLANRSTLHAVQKLK